MSSILLLSATGYAYANTNDFDNEVGKNVSIEQQREQEFRLNKYHEFEEIFPEEMEILKEIQAVNYFNLITKSDNELMEEAANTDPLIDTQKIVDGDIYKLTVYSNGVFAQSGVYGGEVEEVNFKQDNSRLGSTGITGGTTQSGSGYSNGINRKAYCNYFANSAVNLIGHTIESTISYSLVNGAYDSLTSHKLSYVYNTKNVYTYDSKGKENSAGPAYVKYHYDGRTGVNSSADPFEPFEFSISVGSDQVRLNLSFRK